MENIYSKKKVNFKYLNQKSTSKFLSTRYSTHKYTKNVGISYYQYS